jgi:hypothetical protein
MEATIPSTIIRSKFHWFDILLAGLCIFFGLFMIAGLGTSSSVSVRNVDASLGLLKRETPFYFKNLDKIARLTSPINTNAQFAVAIIGDVVSVLREIAILAFKFILKKILGALLSSLRNIMGDLLSSVKTWVKTLSGLLDSVKSFLSALAIKVFAVQECSSKRSADIVSGILGVSIDEADPDLASKCQAGSSGAADIGVQVTVPNYNIIENLTRDDLSTINNSMSNIRASSLLSDVGTGIYPANQSDSSSTTDKGQNTQTTSKVLSQREIATKVDELSNTLGYIKCARITPVKGYSYSSLTAYNLDCTEATITSAQAINQTLAEDKAALQTAKTNINTTAPSDCKQNGFITGTSKTANPSTLAYTPFGDPTSGASFAASAVKYSATFAVNTLTAEQCNNSNQFNTLQTSVETQVSASKSSDQSNTGLDGALQSVVSETVDSLVNEITNILNDFVQKVFQLVIKLVTQFVDSLPGGEFLSSSLTSSLSNSRDEIQNKITESLNQIRSQE